MNQLEQNIMNSFRLAKNDIISLHDKINDLSKSQERMMEIVNKMKDREEKLTQKLNEMRRDIRETRVRRARTTRAGTIVLGKRDRRIVVE